MFRCVCIIATNETRAVLATLAHFPSDLSRLRPMAQLVVQFMVLTQPFYMTWHCYSVSSACLCPPFLCAVVCRPGISPKNVSARSHKLLSAKNAFPWLFPAITCSVPNRTAETSVAHLLPLCFAASWRRSQCPFLTLPFYTAWLFEPVCSFSCRGAAVV